MSASGGASSQSTADRNSPTMQLPPLSLYVHFPWCARKCPYCDFNSHTTGTIPETQYVAALGQDLHTELPAAQGRRLQSIFFGGGTPSLISPTAIAAILQMAEDRIGFSEDIEITLEANPGSVEQAKFEGYRSAGVNRLSIGIQSFQQEFLHSLGRIHSADEALSAVRSAQRAGFTNLNIDLMHGLPGQTRQQALRDIEQAIALQPNHISWYQLTIEPNTEFFNRPPQLPVDDVLADIQAGGERLLASAGYEQYEVSAFAKPGHRSAHNLNYWCFGDYIGIGAGAHSKMTLPDRRLIRRNWKTRLPEHYLSRSESFLAGERELEPGELPLEFAMNTLRLVDGFTLEQYESYTGLSASTLEKPLTALLEQQLLERSGERIRTTPLGQQFLNEILLQF